MQVEKSLFVLVDPNDEKPIALERVLITSRFRNPQPRLVIFVAADGEAIDTGVTNGHLFRDQTWFKEKIRKPVEAAGLRYEIIVSWSSDWQEAIIQEAKRCSAEMIYLPVRAKSSRRLAFAESKWQLLKGAKCPVVLVRPGADDQRKVVLAAVNFQANSGKQRQLNRQIVERAKYIAGNHHAELHIVNAYRDSMHYPDRGALANMTRVPAHHIHVKQGYTSDVVAGVAEDLNADLVVIGTLNQFGSTGTLLRGNTAERIIGQLDVDIVVCNEFTATEVPTGQAASEAEEAVA